jgi:hypothetical protein
MACGSTGSVSTNPTPDELTLANVRDGHVKYNNLKKDQLKEFCATLFDHIEDLQLRLEKAKCPPNTSTPNETFRLRAELKELKDAVFVNEKEDDVSTTSSEAKLAKLAKLVKLAKSTDLWCLLSYVLLSQEAKDKQRKVCPVNLQGEVCTANNCDSKHPKVCLVANHGKGKIPKATCTLWHMQVPFADKSQGNFTGRRSGPKPPPGSKGNNSNNAWPAKLDRYLVKLEAEYRAEELKGRIRATKIMSQGST